MSTISVTNNNPVNPPSRRSFWQTARGYAGIIDSRESTYRTFLDLSGYFLPMTAAAAFRNVWNFLETLFETSFDALAVMSAPYITTLNGYLSSKILLNHAEQKDFLHMLNFQLPELENLEAMKKGLERIKKEEVGDKLRIAELYKTLGKNELVSKYNKHAEEIKNFADRFKPSEQLREKVLKFKKTVILLESFVEGSLFAAEGLLTRLFRKYVLRKDQFTGTLSYSQDSSSNFSSDGEYTLLQKIGIGASFLVAPLINGIFFLRKNNTNNNNGNSIFDKLKNKFDMTHGVFPKLGLLFTYIMFPFISGKLFTAQDKYELNEMLIKQLTLIPSWWFGHRVTNGLIARHEDKKLKAKHGIQGVFVDEKTYRANKNDGFWGRLGKMLPEPSRIHHVLDKAENNENLNKEELVETHAKTLYKGFALHSLLIWLVMMGANYLTKIFVLRGKD